MLVETSLNDSQVMYWEPAKYVAKLRTLKTDAQPADPEDHHGGGPRRRLGALRRVEGARLHLQLRPGPGRAWQVVDATSSSSSPASRSGARPGSRSRSSSGTVAPEASVFYRFLLASLLLFAYCRVRAAAAALHAARARVDRALRHPHVQRELHLRVLRRAAHRLGAGRGGLLGEPAARDARACARSSARR